MWSQHLHDSVLCLQPWGAAHSTVFAGLADGMLAVMEVSVRALQWQTGLITLILNYAIVLCAI